MRQARIKNIINGAVFGNSTANIMIATTIKTIKTILSESYTLCKISYHRGKKF